MRRHGPLLFALLCGCSFDLSADALDFGLDRPFQAELTASPGNASMARAGVFLADNAGLGYAASLDVQPEEGGAIAVVRTDGGVEPFAIEPLAVFEGLGSHTFEITRPDTDASLVLAAWLDDDGDGKLTAGPNAEQAFALHRVYEGEDYYLTYYEYDRLDDAYTATAVSPSIRNLVISSDLATDWTVALP